MDKICINVYNQDTAREARPEGKGRSKNRDRSKKLESGFYAKPENSSPQAVPTEGEPAISMTALLELLKDADPEMKAKLRLVLLT